MSEPDVNPAFQRPWLLPTITGVAGLIVGAVTVLVGGVVAAGVAVGTAEAAKTTVFSDALRACTITNDEDARIGDDGHSLTINNRGDEDVSGISFSDLQCLMTGLDTPDAVVAHVGQTTSQDGRQTETWDGITMSWSYHPDRGLDAVYTIE